MAFTFTNYAALPTAQSPMNALISRALDTFQKGTKAAYLPQQLQTDIQQKQAASQKNIMMSQLLQSLMGGQGGSQGEQDSGQMMGGGGAGGGMNPNMKPALLKGLLGIDPYLMSPQDSQNLKIQGDLKTQANKSNLATGSADVSREFLQDKVSMPQEYMGAAGSFSMSKDMLSAKLGDKDARERLVKAAVAEKLLPEYAGFQLQAQGLKPTVSSLNHQKEAIRQGWPILSQKVTNNLPPELQKEAEKRHNEIVKSINKNRESFYSSGGQERPTFNDKPKSQSYSWSDIQHTAKTRHMTENDVIDKLAKKSGMSIDEFMKNVQSENQ